MLALIDSDTPVFATALVSEDVNEVIAKSRLDECISNIVRDSGCSEYQLFVSGGINFRKDIDPSYKANRQDKPAPKWRETLRLHLINEWNAVECEGYEADDGCGVHQKQDGSTIICGIDKDLLQLPGMHYQWPIIRKGVIVRQASVITITEEDGWRNLFTQVLTGDTSDNIRGVDGIGKVKAARILADCHTEEEMYNNCLDAYYEKDQTKEQIQHSIDRFNKNLDLLFIWRELGITYSIRREIYGRSYTRIFRFPC